MRAAWNRMVVSIGGMVVVACGSPVISSTDAAVVDASPAVDAAMTTDAATDDAGGFVLYAQCATDADCHGDETAHCNTVFPGGMCTVPCAVDADCGDDACWRGYCRPTCTAGGLECEQWQGACARSSTLRSHCGPACDASPAGGELACNEGLACNTHNLACLDPGAIGMGAENGSPCTTGTDCESGLCLPEIDPSGHPTGYIDGICASFGTQVAASEWVAGGPTPRGNCAEGSVLTTSSGSVEGDLEVCLPECTDASDCRPGYDCARGAPPMYTTGYCLPVICDVPGMECPTGYSCQVSAGLSLCAAD
jgi:hypothetical protein